MRVCIEEYRSSILSSGPYACNTVVNAMHLYGFEDPAFPFVYILPRDACWGWLTPATTSTASVSYCLRSSSRRVNAVHLSLEGPAFPFVYKLPAESC
jgi:hypothetical protein